MLGYKIYKQASDIFLSDCFKVLLNEKSSIPILNEFMNKHWFCFDESVKQTIRLELEGADITKSKEILKSISSNRPKFLKTETSREDAFKIVKLLYKSIWIGDKINRTELLQTYFLASKKLKRTKNAVSEALWFIENLQANKISEQEYELIEFFETNLTEIDSAKLKKILKDKKTLILEKDNVNLLFEGKISYIDCAGMEPDQIAKKLKADKVNYFFCKNAKTISMFDLFSDPIKSIHLGPQECKIIKLFMKRKKISTNRAAQFFSKWTREKINLAEVENKKKTKEQFSKVVFKINDCCNASEGGAKGLKIILNANKSRAYYMLNPALKVAFLEAKK